MCLKILSYAILKYLSSNSIPMKLRLVLMQAIPVEPLPAKQSSTTSPSLLLVLIILSNISTGFSQACNLPSFLFFFYFHMLLWLVSKLCTYLKLSYSCLKFSYSFLKSSYSLNPSHLSMLNNFINSLYTSIVHKSH